MYVYGTCVFRMCISALFVGDQMFPNVLLQIVQVIDSYTETSSLREWQKTLGIDYDRGPLHG